jgi:hypothetical protein
LLKSSVFTSKKTSKPKKRFGSSHLRPETPSFYNFSYVCPEPVLAKRSFSAEIGSKRAFLVSQFLSPAPGSSFWPYTSRFPAINAARISRLGNGSCKKTHRSHF